RRPVVAGRMADRKRRHGACRDEDRMSSDLVKLRKYVASIEETHHDGGPVLNRPAVKAVVGGVIANPYAGRHVADIQPMMKALEPLAVDLTERVMKLLGAKGPELEAYGKGVIVGIAGELEHAALWHQ